MLDDNDREMKRIARELRESRSPRMSASFDARVMAVIRRAPRHSRRRLWSRLTTPRTVTVIPLSGGLLAAALLLFALFGATHAVDDVRTATKPIVTALFPEGNEAQRPESVQFVLIAPDAKKVAVVGDFNGWDVDHAGYQAQHRGSGVWSVTAPVPVGHHRYSFIVDDSVWVADPVAPRVADNDYGTTNSAIVVQGHR